MAQTYTDDVYDSTHVGTTDLQNIENNFAALKSSFSGTSSPSNVVGGMPWHDSTARKIRNYANTAWLASLLGDANQKMWVYRNDTCEGWLVDSSITDVALAIKGGSQAYNVNGGNMAGTWTIGGLTNSHYHIHNHKWYDDNNTPGGPGDGTWNSYGVRIAIPKTGTATYSTGTYQISFDDAGSGTSLDHCYTDIDTTTPNTTAVSSDATFRPRAAVGTLQYPDLS